jgi:hypothetical protein
MGKLDPNKIAIQDFSTEDGIRCAQLLGMTRSANPKRRASAKTCAPGVTPLR